MALVTFEDIQKNETIRTYIKMADQVLNASGYTEHSYAHVTRCAGVASNLLLELGYPQRQVELARIAGFLHDIGNVVNRDDHAQSGGIMAFIILTEMGMDAEEVCTIVSAIGNHDEKTAVPVSPIAAALILADKSDVRRSRVRHNGVPALDIHDRVNYSVEKSQLDLDVEKKKITLSITINTDLCPVIDYFEIFLSRMMLCKRAGDQLGLRFSLVINGMAIV
ncbi:MAG: HD domain-containing protein [Oscillospiraceae bacterium]|nr:HD domain-containing protein [Oscillospiraceae bacterium]